MLLNDISSAAALVLGCAVLSHFALSCKLPRFLT
jgi:hypothetical protein